MSSEPERASLGHVPGLDGLRGVAVAAVLLYHGGHLTGGYLGVDLFFTLSGFLITTLLLAELRRTGTIGLGSFWAHRARRLLPALLGLIVGVAAFSAVWASAGQQRGVRGDSIATLLYVANWRSIVAEQGYWSQFGAPSPLRHTWSLAIEEQFYLLWPLVVFGLARLARAWARTAIAVMALVVAAASYAWMAVLVEPGHDTSRAYFGTDTRIGAILLGALLAAVLARPRARHAVVPSSRGSWALDSLALLGGVWLGWAWTNIGGQTSGLYRGGFLVSALAALALIAAAVLRRDGLVARGLSLAPLRGLGIISYGLYLWHWPVFVALELEQERLGLDGWALFAAQVAASLALALASFVLLERPIRTRGFAAWGAAGRAWMPAAAAVSVAMLLVVTTSHAGPTLDDREANQFRPAPAVIPDAEPARLPDSGPSARPEGREPRVLVVGDSVGVDVALGLEGVESGGLEVVDRASPACRVTAAPLPWRIDGVTNTLEKELYAPQRPGWEDVLDTFDPDAVAMVYGGAHLGQASIDGYWVDVCSEALRERWRSETESAIDVLASRGAVVWVVLPADPTMPFMPDGLAEGTRCARDAYQAAADNRPAVARSVPLDTWVCPMRDACRLEVDGVSLRPDGMHYQEGGRAVVSEWLAAQMFLPPSGSSQL